MTDRFLMCAPDFFEVSYVINPWMAGNLDQSRQQVALRQWQGLTRLIGAVAQIELLPTAPGLPDMVFTANAGLVLDKKFVPSNFRHPERQGEEPHYAKWFADNGYQMLPLPSELAFEGAGDALFDRRMPLLWMGYGHRTDMAAASLLADSLGIEVQPLQLVDERFYHLDTCFCPLENGYLMYYPEAFDSEAQAVIAARVPAKYRIAVKEVEAFHFACNAVNSGRNIFMNKASRVLVDELRARGFIVWQTALTQFMKAGGSAKCLTLKLNESRHELAAAA